MSSTKSHCETYPILQSTEPTTGRPVIVAFDEDSSDVIPQGVQNVIYVNSAPWVRPETSWGLSLILVLLNMCYFAGGVMLPAVVLNRMPEYLIFRIAIVPLFYLVLVALVGFLAVCTRSRCVKITYYIFHGVLILLFLMFTAINLVLLSGRFDDALVYNWNQQVRTYSVWMAAGGTLGMVASVLCVILTGKHK